MGDESKRIFLLFRVVMRREQVLKICLNHALTPDITYTPKDDKTWLFVANDFSDGELSLQQFCLRFKSKEIAQDFKDAIDKTRGHPVAKRETESSFKDNDSDDVVFVTEIQATAEEKQKARDLMLPENFFTYKSKDPCQGCRGCNNEDDVKPEATTINKQPTSIKAFPSIASALASTPVKTTISSFQSPMASFYGTPANFDKTIDNSIFRTPLGSIGSNANSVSPITPSEDNNSRNDTTNKENTFLQKSIFGGFAEKSSIFASPQNQSGSIFGSGDTSIGSKASNSILAAPKLSTVNPSGEKVPESTSIFGTSQVKSVFGENKSTFGESKSIFGENKSVFGNTGSGVSSNRSIFGVASDGNKKEDSPKAEVKSLFGTEDQKPVNLFSGASQGSLFGPGALADNQQKPISGFGSTGLFGSTLPQAQQPFESGKSIFSTTNQTTWAFASKTEPTKPDVTSTGAKKTEPVPEHESVKVETPFKVDNSLSFAALSSGTDSDFSKQSENFFECFPI